MPQENAQIRVGTLIANGAVEVNGAPVPVQSTLYAGDLITTHADGTATLTIHNRGEFEIAPATQIVFSDESAYTAQLNFGVIRFDALAESSNLAVRTGDYVVTAAPDAASDTSATVRRTTDGSGLVSCSKGIVQIVALERDTSLALEAGQSTSLASEDSEQSTVVAVVPGNAFLGRPISAVRTHRLRTALTIGIAVGVAAAIIASHHSAPAPTAVRSPSPTPTPTPSPNPTPNPIPTPIPTPTPIPSPTPTPTPTPTPIPIPMPIPTPTPIPNPIPVPIPIPKPTPTPIPLPIPLPITPMPTPVPVPVPITPSPNPVPVPLPIPTSSRTAFPTTPSH